MVTPTGNGYHLRVVVGADNHRLPPFLLRLREDFMDMCHVWAGGIQDLNASAERVDIFSHDSVSYPTNDEQSFTL